MEISSPFSLYICGFFLVKSLNTSYLLLLSNVYFILPENSLSPHGLYLATTYLLDKGHKDIAFFAGQLKEKGVMNKRLQGYKQALQEHNIEYKEEYVFEGQIDYESGVMMADKLIKKKYPVTAIACAADILAIGALKAIYEAGLKVPDDISLIGFDNLEISQYLTPGLTTIKQEISLKGQKAVELLLKHIENPDLSKQEEILPLQIIERDSVKKMM